MSGALAVQKAIRARLVATPAVVALVPASNILDRHSRPAPDPSIILGEDQEIDEGNIARTRQRIHSTIHVWKKEPSLEGVKVIGGAIRTAIHSARLALDTGFHCGDCKVTASRFLRDPDGETSHGIITIETLIARG